jgi:Holliday junction resolvase RusA-like endonuclease
VIRLDIIGEPAPQGSKSAFNDKRGNARMIEGSSPTGRAKHKAWRQAVSAAAAAIPTDQRTIQADDPVSLTVTFFMPKPNTARRRDWWCWKKPDVDKLLRATADGLADGGLLPGGDSRIVELFAFKTYAEPGTPSGARVLLCRAPVLASPYGHLTAEEGQTA